MLPTLYRRVQSRLFAVLCIVVGCLAGCGGSGDTSVDASVDISNDGGGSDANAQDISADTHEAVDASSDAALDKAPSDGGTTDTGADKGADVVGTVDRTAEDSVDGAGSPDARIDDANDVADGADASDVASETGADAGLEIVALGTYGPYVVQSIAINGAPPGSYTFAVAGPTAGTVTLRRDGIAVKTFDYNWQTTVSASDPGMFYTFDFPGHLAITIRKAGSGSTNLYEMDQSIFDGAHFLVVLPGADGSTPDGGTVPISAGGTYLPYVVESVVMAGAPSGAYTFHVTSATAGSVELRRNGSPVTTLSYSWQTTVSATDSNLFYAFDFAGYFNITIRKAGSGTMNLYSMDQSIFDGVHVLTVIADGGGGD